MNYIAEKLDAKSSNVPLGSFIKDISNQIGYTEFITIKKLYSKKAWFVKTIFLKLFVRNKNMQKVSLRNFTQKKIH